MDNSNFLQFNMADIHRPKRCNPNFKEACPPPHRPASKINKNANVKRCSDLLDPTSTTDYTEPSPIVIPVKQYPDFNDLSYMMDPCRDEIEKPAKWDGHEGRERYLDARVNPSAHDYRLTDRDVIDWEKYRMFPHSNVPTLKSEYNQLEHFKIYPHMYSTHTQLRKQWDNAKFIEPKKGAVRYPIPMHFQLRSLQKKYPRCQASGADYEMRARDPSRDGTHELPDGDGAPGLTRYLKYHNHGTQTAQLFKFPTCKQRSMLPPSFGFGPQCVTGGNGNDEEQHEFTAEDDGITVGTSKGFMSQKCKDNNSVRFYSDKYLKGTEYTIKRPGLYDMDIDNPLVFRSFLVPAGWVVKMVYNNRSLNYHGLRGVSDYTKPLEKLRGIRIIRKD